MAIKLENKTNTDAPNAAYPYGKVRDKTPSVNGTPVNTSVYGDIHQFFARILDRSGVVANGLVENFTNGFQYFEAILKLGFKYNSDPIVRALLLGKNVVVSGELVILHNLDFMVVGNNITYTAGAVYYNFKTYLLQTGAATKTTPQTFVFSILSEEESTMQIIAGSSGSGIVDYNNSLVIRYVDFLVGIWVNVPSLLNGWSFPLNGYLKYKKDYLGNITLKGYITSPSSATNNKAFVVPSLFMPNDASVTPVPFIAVQNSGITIQGKLKFGGDLELALPDGSSVAINSNFQFHVQYSAIS